ncbi:hypothetical protein [Thermoflexus sp.]|uniref:hypothetical protein n=1 Tax=Thermoflexus sp. TaxID=1969742 RepID=UPI002ADD32C0|nr:hypothetical protein [Thermoflexus sp.]
MDRKQIPDKQKKLIPRVCSRLHPSAWGERVLDWGWRRDFWAACVALLFTYGASRGLGYVLRPSLPSEWALVLIQIQVGLAGVAIPIMLLVLERMGEADEILPVSRALLRRSMALPLFFYALLGLLGMILHRESPFALATVLLTGLWLLLAYSRALVLVRDPEGLRGEALGMMKKDGRHGDLYGVQRRLEHIAQKGRRAVQERAWRQAMDALEAWEAMADGLAAQLERDLNRAYDRQKDPRKWADRLSHAGRLVASMLEPFFPALPALSEDPDLRERFLELPQEFLQQSPLRPQKGHVRWASGLQIMIRVFPHLPPDLLEEAAREWAEALAHADDEWFDRDPDRGMSLAWAAAGLGAAALLKGDPEAAQRFIEVLDLGGPWDQARGPEYGAALLHLAAMSIGLALRQSDHPSWELLKPDGPLARALRRDPFPPIALRSVAHQDMLFRWAPAGIWRGSSEPIRFLQMALAWGAIVKHTAGQELGEPGSDLVQNWLCPGLSAWRDLKIELGGLREAMPPKRHIGLYGLFFKLHAKELHERLGCSSERSEGERIPP